jgi:glycosyltransferase involved in cell wall biosynthesis
MENKAMNSKDKKIRILLATRPLVPPWDEASKNFAYFLAKSIRDPELEFHLLTTDETLEELGANCVQHPIFGSGHFDLKAKMRLAMFLFTQSHRFDIVHYLFTPTPFNSFLLKNFTWKRPKTIQTIATLREERWEEREWKQMFFADRLVTYTDHSKAKLEETGFSNVERIYPGIDLERFAPRPKDPETLKKLNLSPDDFVVSYVGEYARLGATDMIVDMLVRRFSLSSHSPHSTPSSPFKFLFALRVKNDADRKKKEEIQEKFREAGILEHIRFSDTVFDVAALYSLADIITFPVADMHGKFDVPLVILEAYASGKPVILSDLPLFREFSNPNISVTIPRGDGDALWRAIESLRHDETKRNALSTDARAFVERSFNLRETAERYMDAYSGFLKQGGMHESFFLSEDSQ